MAESNDPVALTGKLCELFPADDPNSPWLLRLMILRDDLEYEVRNLALEQDDGSEEAWRCVYFLRRVSVTLLEIKSLLSTHVLAAVKSPPDSVTRGLRPHLQTAFKLVEQHEAVLKQLRDRMGAHVRPQNNSKTVDIERQILRQHPHLAGTVTMHFGKGDTSYRQLSGCSILFAWPNADSDNQLEEHHEALQKAIHDCVPIFLNSIDALLMWHWWKLGLVAPPSGYDFGVLVHGTEDRYRPVDKPPR